MAETKLTWANYVAAGDVLPAPNKVDKIINTALMQSIHDFKVSIDYYPTMKATTFTLSEPFTPVTVDAEHGTAFSEEDLIMVAKTLESAADYIDQVGWVQGTTRSYENDRAGLAALSSYRPAQRGKVIGVCAMGAIEDSGHQYDMRLAARIALTQWLVREHGVHKNIPAYNDDQGRTKEEVTGAMRSCAMNIRDASFIPSVYHTAKE